MPSVGSHLRQLRETRGISLEEIARATRVNSSYLVALETDDHASLPVPVFTRGFIRAYCQALGEAPEQSLALYDGRGDVATAVATPSAAATASAAAPARPAAPPRQASAPEPVRRPEPIRRSNEPPPKNRGPVLVSFVLLVVLGVALFAVTLLLQSGREPAEDRRVARAPARMAELPPAGTPASVPAPAPSNSAVPVAPTGYRLVARALETTWMRVRTEEGKTIEETIPAGQIREWFSSGPFTLTIGNAGGVQLELNGRSLPPLGASGVVIPRMVLPPESQ
jgi:cytoskeleton protein RodZ